MKFDFPLIYESHQYSFQAFQQYHIFPRKYTVLNQQTCPIEIQPYTIVRIFNQIVRRSYPFRVLWHLSTETIYLTRTMGRHSCTFTCLCKVHRQYIPLYGLKVNSLYRKHRHGDSKHYISPRFLRLLPELFSDIFSDKLLDPLLHRYQLMRLRCTFIGIHCLSTDYKGFSIACSFTGMLYSVKQI